MNRWYVKDFSKLVGISVQTLHHYDQIGVLSPSVRLPNGYRLYSEKDLFRLKQVLALKYFGFELSQINTLLSGKVNPLEFFSKQARRLEEKSVIFMETSKILNKIIADMQADSSIPWEAIIKSVEKST